MRLDGDLDALPDTQVAIVIFFCGLYSYNRGLRRKAGVPAPYDSWTTDD